MAVLTFVLSGFLLVSSCSPFAKGGSTGPGTEVHDGRTENHGHKDRGHRRQGHRGREGGSETSSETDEPRDPSSSDTHSVTAPDRSSPGPAREQRDTVPRRVVNNGKKLYDRECSSCHGSDRQGGFFYPSLVEVEEKLSREEIHDLLRRGRGRMPSFSELSPAQREAIVSYLLRE